MRRCDVGASWTAMDFAILALHIAGASSILGRDQLHHHDLQHACARMTLHKMPLFVWAC